MMFGKLPEKPIGHIQKSCLRKLEKNIKKIKTKKLWTLIKHRKTDSIDIAQLKNMDYSRTHPGEKAEILNTQLVWFSPQMTYPNSLIRRHGKMICSIRKSPTSRFQKMEWRNC